MRLDGRQELARRTTCRAVVSNFQNFGCQIATSGKHRVLRWLLGIPCEKEVHRAVGDLENQRVVVTWREGKRLDRIEDNSCDAASELETLRHPSLDVRYVFLIYERREVLVRLSVIRLTVPQNGVDGQGIQNAH